jgi:hypothetical protein
MLVLAAWCGIQAYRLSRQEGWKWLFLALWFAFPISCLLIFSLVYKPVLVGRYLIMCLPPLVLLAAGAISRLRKPAIRAGVLGALMALSIYGVYRQYQIHQRNEDWRSATAYISANASSRDAVILYHPVGWLGLQFYWDRVSQTRMPFGRMFPRTFDYPRLLSGGPATPDEEWVKNSTANCERIWLILSVNDPSKSKELWRTVSLYYPLVKSQKEFRGIGVVLYESSSGSP